MDNKKQTFTEEYLKELHKHSSCNETQLRSSHKCGCFSCETVFNVKEITEWYKNDNEERTAICPYCWVDSVLGDSCGVEITPQLLGAMNRKYF